MIIGNFSTTPARIFEQSSPCVVGAPVHTKWSVGTLDISWPMIR